MNERNTTGSLVPDLGPEHGNRRQDMLLQAVRDLHSRIDVETVLRVLMERIQGLFPGACIDILLSQDHQTELPGVKPLLFRHDIDDLGTQAFMQNRYMLRCTAVEQGQHRSELAVPLSGKQGVYGVLRMNAEDIIESEYDLELVTVLADSAGIAFENAKLYEQSNMLLQEFRLINEITKRLNQSLKLNEIFNFASSELMHVFQADFTVILQLDRSNECFQVCASNMKAVNDDTFPIDYGFCGIVYRTKEPVIISDYVKNPVVGSQLMEITGSRSLLATPMLSNNEVIGVILVAHSKPNFFTYENYKLLQTISGHIGLAMMNASLHSEVRRMVITDHLTGLYARHYLDEQVSSRQKKDNCGSLIVVDIDNFKLVNDTYGHQIGDRILIQVSGIIQSSIRETDIPARWGGEELAVYLPQVSIEQGVRIAERIRSRVNAETDPQVTVSCGISEWNREDEKISVEHLFYKADMALYQAKHSGKNQYKIG